MLFAPRRIAPFAMTAMAIAISASAFAAPQPAASPTQMSERDKVSYAVGMKLGTDIVGFLQQIKGEVDIPVTLRAIDTVVSGGKPQMTIPEAQTALQGLTKKMQARQAADAQKQQQQQKVQSQKNLADGAAFLAANAKKPGVKTTASGLQYQVVKDGTGPKAKSTDTVKVNYVGTLLDGSQFDSSAKNGGPVSFQVTGVIPGWTEGLQLMNVGSKFVFWIPAKLAYGERPGGPGGPNSMLKFEVELVSIAK
jgi:FKBP-type peptidyl-prolyl cis-trans isomerase